ncbi:MAG: phage/plasmid primase, P4 family, partial [Sciscionella sp.]
VLAAWFAGSNDGVFLHAGRSGAVVFDVDAPDKLGGVVLAAIGEHRPPIQSTRTDHPGRGHYVFAQPAGRTLGNGLGKLAGGWGEIRGRNGVIVAAPTTHEKAATGGRYLWSRTGPVPVLPETVAELLNDSTPGNDAATDAEVRTFLDEHTGTSRAALLDVWVSTFSGKVAEGESRHDRMVSICAGAMAEARAGYYPARTAMERLEIAFLDAVSKPGHGQQGKERGPGMARSEWAGISAWAVAQANSANLDDTRARVAEKVPDGDDLSWIADPESGEDDGEAGQPRASPLEYFHPQHGLLASKLARHVLDKGPLAQGVDDRMWRYCGGVWRPEKSVVRNRCARLLGDLFRIGHVSNVEHVVRSRVPEIACDPVPEYINFRNGLLDWRTGQLHPHTPDVLTTVQLPVDYDSDASCPAFEEFLASVVPADMLLTVWELIGYLMYSGNPLHKAVMLMGRGRNGKGTLLRVINAVLGVRNVTSVSLHDLVNTRFSTASLFGKLANIAGDIDGGYLENTAVFKAITGGDQISAEHKGRDRFDFSPWAVPVFSANKIPASSDTTSGYLSRWVVLPFPNSFEGREDRTLDTRLRSAGELRGIAARGVAALPELLKRGDFILTESAKNARDEFIRRVDQVRTWINDCTEEDADHWVYRTDLYHAYQTWANRDGYKPLRAGEFYDRLESAGAATAKVHGKRGFTGLRVVDNGMIDLRG